MAAATWRAKGRHQQRLRTALLDRHEALSASRHSLHRWCACYKRKHFADEAPAPAAAPPSTSKAAATAAASKAGKDGKGQVAVAADARAGTPRSSGAQFIASWHAKQGSLRDQYSGGGAGDASEQGSASGSPRPSLLAAGSLQAAAAAAADRAELLGSRGGSAAGRPRSVSPAPGSQPHSRSASGAALEEEAANRSELLSSLRPASSKGSSGTPAARAGGKGGRGVSRLRSLFKVGWGVVGMLPG